VASISTWIATARPALMVIDVSVEIAMLARLASVPTIYVRLNGDRSDPPHLDAFAGASAILAPFHPQFERPETPEWVKAKTHYLPAIAETPVTAITEERSILVVAGRGGPPVNGAHIAEAARACPQWQWRVIGPVQPVAPCPPNLTFAGWVDDPAREIARAAIVVGAAGDGLVNALLATDRPFICLPEDRPFGEQHATAQALDRLGAALVLDAWPSPSSWPALIDRAFTMPTHVRRQLHDPAGTRKAAAWLALCAARATDSTEQAA
jgi:predicted glycosyltransferase